LFSCFVFSPGHRVLGQPYLADINPGMLLTPIYINTRKFTIYFWRTAELNGLKADVIWLKNYNAKKQQKRAFFR